MLSLQKKLVLLLVAFLCGFSLIGSASANKIDKYYHETMKLNEDDSKYDNLNNYVNKDEINYYLTSLNSKRKDGHIFILFEYTMTPDKSSWSDVIDADIQNDDVDDDQMFPWASESQKDIMITLKKEHGKLHVGYFSGENVPSTVNKKELNKLVKKINNAPADTNSEEQTKNLKLLIKKANFYQNEHIYFNILKITMGVLLLFAIAFGLFVLNKKYSLIKKVVSTFENLELDEDDNQEFSLTLSLLAMSITVLSSILNVFITTHQE